MFKWRASKWRNELWFTRRTPFTRPQYEVLSISGHKKLFEGESKYVLHLVQQPETGRCQCQSVVSSPWRDGPAFSSTSWCARWDNEEFADGSNLVTCNHKYNKRILPLRSQRKSRHHRPLVWSSDIQSWFKLLAIWRKEGKYQASSSQIGLEDWYIVSSAKLLLARSTKLWEQIWAACTVPGRSRWLSKIWIQCKPLR